MEFGTRPLPDVANECDARGYFSGTPTGCKISAHGKKTVRYVMFLFTVPPEVNTLGSLEPADGSLEIQDASGTLVLAIPGKGCKAFLDEAEI